MTLFQSSFLIACVVSSLVILAQGIFTLWKNPFSHLTRWWFILSIFVSGWCLFYGLGVTQPDFDRATIFIFWSLVLAPGICPAYIAFATALFPGGLKYKPLFLLSAIISVFTIILVVNGQAIEFVSFPPFHFYWKARFAYILQPINTALLPTIIVILGWFEMKKATGQKRSQISYFLLASVAGFFTGDIILLPAYGIEIIPYTMYLFWLYPLIITYAIIKHRLMDISVVLRKSLIYSTTLALITAVLFGAMYFIGSWLSQRYFGYSITFSVLLVLIMGLLFQPLRQVIEKLIDRLFGKARYEYVRALEELGRQISSDEDAHATVEKISQRLTQIVGARYGRVEVLKWML